MKHLILSILFFNAILAYAQEDSEPLTEATQNDSALVETATVSEPPAESANVEETANEPERTPEGYRIIRIGVEDTKQYKDSVAKVEKEIEEAKKPTIPFRFTASLMATIGYKGLVGNDPYRYYCDPMQRDQDPVSLFHGFPFEVGLLGVIPLSEATIAIKIGALYEYTYLLALEDFFLKSNESSDNPWLEKQQREPEHGNITQMRVSFPMLLALKGRSSPAMFEIGLKLSIPILDEYESVNFVDYNLRPTVDVGYLIGATVIINKYFSIIGHLEIQPSDVYDDKLFVGVPDIMLVAYRIGVLFTPF